MIKSFLKLSLTLLASYIFLSFELNGKYLFNHLTDLTGPLGENIQHSLSKAIKNSWIKVRDLGQGYFKESAPKIEKTFIKGKKVIEHSIGLDSESSAGGHSKAQKGKIVIKKPKQYFDDLGPEDTKALYKIIESDEKDQR